MAFRVGQKVVCVDVRDLDRAAFFGAVPVKDAIYHIRAVVTVRGRIYVRLCEIVMPPTSYIELGEGAFCATRFRPIVERKTDISIFKRMLTDQKIEA